jgi:hypothetical protein
MRAIGLLGRGHELPVANPRTAKPARPFLKTIFKIQAQCLVASEESEIARPLRRPPFTQSSPGTQEVSDLTWYPMLIVFV